MTDPDLKRRDFSKLTLAALGGLISGCADEANTPATGGGNANHEAQAPQHDAAGQPETQGPVAHACRGLNECRSANNECAGLSTCATKSWIHDCAGMNECKGQGGCGDNALKNECKGHGNCSIPLMDSLWEKARAEMEEKWKKTGRLLGPAPAKAG